MTDELRRGLVDLATEVSVVWLRDRALATSRRLTRRRRVLAATAVAVAVAVITGGAIALRPAGLAGPQLPPGQSASPFPSPTSTPSTSPPPSSPVADPLAPTLGAWVSTPRDSLPGVAVYLSFDEVAGELGIERYQVFVHRLDDGFDEAAPLGPVVNSTDCSVNIPSVSPDGSMVLMAAGGVEQDGIVEGASLFVTDLATGVSRRLVNDILCAGVSTIWSPDSSRAVVPTFAGCQWVDVVTGALTPFTDSDVCTYLALAPGGELWAQYPYLMTSTGTVVAELPRPSYFPTGSMMMTQAVSADGRFVAMGTGSTDLGYDRQPRWLFDTSTGQFLSAEEVLGASHGGEVITNTVFRTDGRIVVSSYRLGTGAHRWYLLSRLMNVVVTIDAPGPILTGQFTSLP